MMGYIGYYYHLLIAVDGRGGVKNTLKKSVTVIRKWSKSWKILKCER